MSDSHTHNPLVGPPPPNVLLPQAPLVRVIAQVRFPLIVSVDQPEFIAPFQEAIRAVYPVLRTERDTGIALGPDQQLITRQLQTWRFWDAEEAWSLSLTSNFIALEAHRYTHREDFLARLGAVLQALEEHAKPYQADRIGVRYIDQLQGEPLSRISRLLHPEVAGVLGGPMGGSALQAVTEHLFPLEEEEGKLRARWGLLAAGTTLDPRLLPPLDTQSWVLDLDAFTEKPQPFKSELLLQQASAFARRIYTFFRWSVTDEFLSTFGATP